MGASRIGSGARLPPLALPDSRAMGVPQEAGLTRSRPRSLCCLPGDRIAIQVVTGDRHWDSLAADTDAVTLGKRSPGPTPGPSHSPTASPASAVRALIGRAGGTGPRVGPTHSPAVPASPPPNVVSSCLTISACFFSLRVTLAANTTAEATMIARGT